MADPATPTPEPGTFRPEFLDKEQAELLLRAHKRAILKLATSGKPLPAATEKQVMSVLSGGESAVYAPPHAAPSDESMNDDAHGLLVKQHAEFAVGWSTACSNTRYSVTHAVPVKALILVRRRLAAGSDDYASHRCGSVWSVGLKGVKHPKYAWAFGYAALFNRPFSCGIFWRGFHYSTRSRGGHEKCRR